MAYIGDILVPEITPSGTFPIVPDYGYGHAIQPDIAIHQFGSANAKIEQRFLLGNGAKRFTVRRAQMREADRTALRDFWETKYGPYGAFTYNAPNDDGNGTTAYICRFANEPVSWEFLSDAISSVGITLIEIPTTSPSYTLNSTVTRFPSSGLQTALLSQVQQIIPLIKIQVREIGYAAIYLSDRECTVGGQLYLARLLEFDGISQAMGNESDEAQFTFGNADRVMRELANDTDLFRASIEFSLFHVGTGIKLDLWKGEIVDWQFDAGPEFRVTAADGMYELNLPYPTRKVSRSCWKCYNDANGCPYATQGSMDYVHFPSADPAKCDKSYDAANGCLAHGMKRYFGGVLAEPQGVTVKDNSTGVWGFGRSLLTSVSIVAESIYDEVIPEIYTDSNMPVNCKIAAGREESDFYDALGIVGEGPLVLASSGHTLDGQYHHGYPGLAGIRWAWGYDPALTGDFFSLGQLGDQTGGDWRKVYYGGSTWKDNFSAGIAFLELRRKDEPGLQLSRPSDHAMQAIVTTGLQGWVWTAAGSRSQQTLTNPVWIAINMLLRARGLRFADAATAEQYFDVEAAIAAASICNQSVAKIIGSGNETQFKFRGVAQEEKPLRDWIQEVLMNCLGYYSFCFGKLKTGIRSNSSVIEAFTVGNILFQSLQLSPIKPEFNYLSANFADEEFEFVANAVSLYDIDHAKLIGGATAPLFLKGNINLSGTSGKSQAARIISTRLREELGGINAAQWKAARALAFRTTVLALNTEPGMVCSMTHSDMPAGAGEFRITAWRLNRDYSIDVQGQTTVDEMYDLTTGPKPADVAASDVPVEPAGWNRRAPGGKSVAGTGNTSGNPTLTELFVQDDLNPDLYHRKVKVEFTPPPTTFKDIFPRRAEVSTPQVFTTGGSIPGNQTIYVEVCNRADGVDGLTSDPLIFTIPAGTNTNRITFQCRLPSQATHYVVRVGSHVGRAYQLGNAISSPGTSWFEIAITDISVLNSALLSPDPRFHHVRAYYFYDSSPGIIRDGGVTSGPTEDDFTFEPEPPEAADTKITVVLCAANEAETERYSLDDSPQAELTLTKDTGNPSGASGLQILTNTDDSKIPPGQMVFQFNRDTANYSSIGGVAVWLHDALPAEGPYKAEREAHPSCVIETGSCSVTAGSKQVTVTRSPNSAVLQRVLLIYTDDASPDSDLEGEIIKTEGTNSLTVNTPFNKSGTFTYAIVKRWWDIAGADTGNAWYQWFPIDQLGDPEQAIWRTPPVPHPTGTFYATAAARNRFGVGARMTAGPKTFTSSTVPTDSVLPGAPTGLQVTGADGKFIGDWIDPATGANTLDDVCIQYATDASFTENVVTCAGWGHVNHKEGADPDKTYYFRVACHNQSGLTSNSTVHDAINAAGHHDDWDADHGWGPFCSGIGPISSGPIKLQDLQVTTGKLAAGAVTAAKAAAGIIDAVTKFVSSLKPVEIVSSLPSPGTQGRTVFLTTDNKLYRDTGSAWTAVVPAADVGAGLTGSQIAAATITASNIQASTITSNELAANSVIAGKIAAGAVDSMVITAPTIRTDASGQRVELDSTNGLRGIDASANVLTQIDVDGKATFKSGVSAARFEFSAANGLRGFNSSGTEVLRIDPAVDWGLIRCTAIRMHPNVSGGITIGGRTDSPNDIAIVTADGSELGNACKITMVHGASGYINFWTQNTARITISSDRIKLDGAVCVEMGNMASEPAAPAAGGILYAWAGALKYVSAGNTRTEIAPN